MSPLLFNRARPRAVLLACALLAGGMAVAQTPAPPKAPSLDPVIVTAARVSQPIADALADVTVIGAEEIQRSGVQSLAELLQRQPGVEIVQNGGPGSVSGALLRGANRGQTLVLVDGLRVGSSSAGSTTLEAIPLDQIDRIEILRGPASSLYGADAIGGVVQVFTKGARGGPQLTTITPNLSAGFGTYNTGAVSAGFSGATGSLRYSLLAGGRTSDGFNAIVNPDNFSYNPDRDGFNTRNLSANLNWTWSAGQELAAQYFGNRLDAQFDGGAPYFDDRTITTVQTWSATSRNKVNDIWTSILTAGQGSDDSVSQASYVNSSFKTTQRQYFWQNDLTLQLGTLGVIIERREEHLSTDADFAVTNRNTNSATGVYQFRYDAFALQANLRRDDSSQYGGQTTGGLALGYAISPAWRVTLGGSTGFKAPTFNDLYYPGFSNPDLVPETSKNVEAGVYWNAAQGEVRWEVRAIGFHNQVMELIVFACDANFSCAPKNVNRATLEGVTLGLGLTWRDTRVKASLDLQNPTDDTTGRLLPRRARQHGAVQVLQPAGPVQLGAEFVASSLRYDDAANTIKMGGYGIVNVTLEWPFAKGFAVLLRGNNVFNKNYQLAADFATGGATFYAGLRWQP
ncbi:MAG: TonB-dependent receptor [Betaproteobacteria bacterium]